MNNVKLLTKISTKSVLGEPKPGDCYDIIGVATNASTSSENSQYGDYTFFTGNFRAITADGTVYSSHKLFLPATANASLLSVLQADDNEQKHVEFGFAINLVEANNKAGYEFICAPLMQPSEDDPLAKLQDKLLHKQITN